MSELIHLILAGGIGLGLGFFYFGGLWLTVRHLPNCRSPELFTLGSFALRVAVTLLGFYLVMGDRWERLLACMIGFILLRTLLVYRLNPKSRVKDATGGEEIHP